jgi:hypothetical protein
VTENLQSTTYLEAIEELQETALYTGVIARASSTMAWLSF